MKFVTLRVWHPDCWMLELSDRHRGVCVESRGVCTHAHKVHTDALVYAEHPETLADALASRVPDDVHRQILHAGPRQAEVYSNYPTYRSIYEATTNTGFLVLGPILHENGYEKWEILTDSATLKSGLATLKDAGEVTVERIGDTRATPKSPKRDLLADAAPEGISPRQLQTLQRAVDAGYYNWPRTTSAKELAAQEGVSGPAFLEHLRRAESRLVPAALDALRKKR